MLGDGVAGLETGIRGADGVGAESCGVVVASAGATRGCIRYCFAFSGSVMSSDIGWSDIFLGVLGGSFLFSCSICAQV